MQRRGCSRRLTLDVWPAPRAANAEDAMDEDVVQQGYGRGSSRRAKTLAGAAVAAELARSQPAAGASAAGAEEEEEEEGEDSDFGAVDEEEDDEEDEGAEEGALDAENEEEEE